MPPKTRVTESMIVGAAVEVVRRRGYENINARTVSEQLRCSTQPVMYHFSTIDNLKRAAYRHADQLHTQYLLNTPPGEDPVAGIGLNYIRFAVEEPQLFRFLFQSGYAEENSEALPVPAGGCSRRRTLCRSAFYPRCGGNRCVGSGRYFY